MATRTATYHDILAYEGRRVSHARPARALLNAAFVVLSAAAIVAALIAAVTFGAAWMFAAFHTGSPTLGTNAPFAPGTVTFAVAYGARAGAVATSSRPRSSTDAAVALAEAPHAERRPAPSDNAGSSWWLTRTLFHAAPLRRPRPLDNAGTEAKHDVALAPDAIVEERGLGGVLASVAAGQALPGPGERTAVYDIAAHTVYMPDGTTLTAHSGLGHRQDDPRFVRERNRGPTPPNVYRLALREELFHGVRAIRLNPLDEDKMFGRDGMLAHTYMLGPAGESNGCVSFKNYPKFLQAFLDGEVEHLVVVPRLSSEALRTARPRRGHDDRVALNDR